jgi:hypothetical protein
MTLGAEFIEGHFISGFDNLRPNVIPVKIRAGLISDEIKL